MPRRRRRRVAEPGPDRARARSSSASPPRPARSSGPPASSGRKRVDLLVANDVAEAGSGFGTDTNRVVILDAAGGRDELPLLSKREVADRLLDRVAAALDERDAAGQTARMQEAQR